MTVHLKEDKEKVNAYTGVTPDAVCALYLLHLQITSETYFSSTLDRHFCSSVVI